MSARCVVLGGLVAAGFVVSAGAQAPAATVQISVRVERSCRVATGAQVSLDCGSRPQAVQVRQDDAPLTLRTVSAPTPVAPATARTVTIHF